MTNHKIIYIPAKLQMFVPAFVSEIKRHGKNLKQEHKIAWFIEPALLSEQPQADAYLADFNVNYDIVPVGFSYYKKLNPETSPPPASLNSGSSDMGLPPPAEKISLKKKIKNKLGYKRDWYAYKTYEFFNSFFIGRKILRVYSLLFVLRPGSLHNRIYKDVQSYFLRENPAALVIGSDQGGQAVLYAIEACYKFKIPVFVYSICDIEKIDPKLEFNHKVCDFLNHFDSDYFSFVKATLYKGNIIGAYPRKSFITTVSPEFSKKIQERAHLTAQEVALVYPPGFEVSENAKEELKDYLDSRPASKPLLSFYTENLIPIYGVDYWKDFSTRLKETLQILAKDFTVIIKLHPDESEAGYEILKQAFTETDIKISKSFNTQYLIQSSSVCVAHFSRVLIEAMQMHIPIISINILKDRTRSFIPEELSAGIEVRAFSEILPLCEEIKSFGKIQNKNYQRSYAELHRKFFPSQDKSLIEFIDHKLSELSS